MKRKKCIAVLTKRSYLGLFGPLSINSNDHNTGKENIDFYHYL